MGIKKRTKNIIEKFLSGEKGKRFFQIFYSVGASIVIVGALAKLNHWAAGSLLLTIGMGAEFFVFLLSAFDKPAKEYHWDQVFPLLNNGESNGNGYHQHQPQYDGSGKEIIVAGGGSGSGNGGGSNGTVIIGGGSSGGFVGGEGFAAGGENTAAGSGGSVIIGGGGGVVGGGVIGGGGYVGGYVGNGEVPVDGETVTGGGFVGGGVIGGGGYVGGGGVVGGGYVGGYANNGEVPVDGETVTGGGFVGGGVIGGGYVGGGGGYVGGGGYSGSGSGSGEGSSAPQSATEAVAGMTTAQVRQSFGIPNAVEISEEDANALTSSIKKMASAADQLAKMTEMTDATQQYLDQIASMSENMEKFSEVTNNLTNVSDILLNSYKSITDNSDGINQSARGYVHQMETLNRNIQGLNTIYEIQLKSVSSQIDAIERINSGLGRIKDLYEGSIVDSSVFRSETEKMSQQLRVLNDVYARLLNAMTVNMYGGGNPVFNPNPGSYNPAP